MSSRIYWQGGGPTLVLPPLPKPPVEEDKTLPGLPTPGPTDPATDLPPLPNPGDATTQRPTPDLSTLRPMTAPPSLRDLIQRSPDPGKMQKLTETAVAIHASLGVPFTAAFQHAKALQDSPDPKAVGLYERFHGGLEVADLKRQVNELALLDMAEWFAGTQEAHPAERAQIAALRQQAGAAGFDGNDIAQRLLMEQADALENSILTPRQKEMKKLTAQLEERTKETGEASKLNVLFTMGTVLSDIAQASREGFIPGLATGGMAAAAGSVGGPAAGPAFVGGFLAGEGAGVSAYFARQMTGQSWVDMTKDDSTNRNVAFVLSLASGGLQAALEAVGGLAIAKTIPGVETVLRKTLGDLLMQPALKQTVTRRVGEIIGEGTLAVAKETWEELAQNAVDQGAKVLADRLDELIPGGPGGDIAPSWQEYLKNQAMTAAITPIISGLMAAPGVSLNLAMEGKQAVKEATAAKETPQEAEKPINAAEPLRAKVDTTLEAVQAARDQATPETGPVDMAPHVTALQGHATEIMTTLDAKVDEAGALPEIGQTQLQEIMDLAETHDMVTREIGNLTPVTPTETAVTGIIPTDIREAIRTTLPQFSEREVTAAGLVVDFRAKREGIATPEYVANTFAPGVFSPQAVAQGVIASEPNKNAAVQFLEDGKALIHAAEQTDFKALVHEFAHVFRRQLSDAEQTVVADTFGTDTTAEERFAEGFVTFLQGGQTANPALAPLFKEMSDLLANFRNTFDDMIPDETKAVFDGILGGEQKQAVAPGGEEIFFNPISMTPTEGERTPGRRTSVTIGDISLTRDQLGRIDERLPDVMESFIRGNNKSGLIAALADIDLDLFVENEVGRQAALGAITQAVEQTDPKNMSVRAQGPGNRPDLLFNTADDTQAEYELAKTFSTPEEYAEMARNMDVDPKTDAEYAKVWEAAQDAPVSRSRENARFLSSIETKADLEAMLLDMWRAEGDQPKLPNMTGVHALFTTAVEGAPNGISDAHYKKLMDQIRNDPRKYRTLIARVLGDEEMKKQIAREVETDPQAAALEQEKATNRELRRKNAKLKQSISGLEKDIAGWKKAVDREQDRTMQATGLAAETWVTGHKTEEQRKQDLKDLREAIQTKTHLGKVVKDLMRPVGVHDGVVTLPLDIARAIRKIQDSVAVSGKRALASQQEAIRNWQAKNPGKPLTPAAQAIMDRRYVKDIDPDVLEALHQEVKDLRARGRQQIARERAIEWQEAIKDLNDAIVSIGNVNSDSKRKRVAQRVVKALGGENQDKLMASTPGEIMAWLFARPDRYAMFLDGGKKGANYNLLIERTDAAEREAASNRTRRFEAIGKKQTELGIKDRELRKRFTTTDGNIYNHNEALAVYMTMQDPNGKRHIVKGNKLSAETIQQMTDELSPQEKAFGDFIMEQFQGQDKERLRRFAEETLRKEFGDVERYFPLYVDQGKVAPQMSHEEQLLADMTAHGNGRRASLSKKMIEKRTGSAAPIHINAMAITKDAIQKQEHLMAYHALLKRLHFVYDHPSMVGEIRRLGGDFAVAEMKQHLDVLANPAESHQNDLVMKMGQKVLSNVTVAGIAWNVKSAAKQFPLVGMWQSLPYTGRTVPESIGYMMGAAAEWVASIDGQKRLYDFVTSRDVLIKERVLDPVQAAIRQTDWMKQRNAVQRAGRIGMFAVEQFDLGTVLIAWKAAYNFKLRESEGDTQAAIAHAREAIQKTQPQGKSKDLSHYGRGFGRFLSPWGGMLNQMYNIMMYDLPMTLKNRDIAGAERFNYATRWAASVIITGILMGIANRLRLPEDAGEATADVLDQILSPFQPFGGVAYNLISGPLTGQQRWGYGAENVIVKPAVEAATSAATAVRAVAEGDAEKAAWKIAEMIPPALRLAGGPAVPVQRTIHALQTGDILDFFGGQAERD